MAQEIKPNVGLRLRSFRERQGWSLRALALRCGLSINAISRIERGENSPTVSSLHRLASALSVPITDFFLERPKQAAVMIRNGAGQHKEGVGFVVEHLGSGLPGQQLEPFLFTTQPNHNQAIEPVSHPGEEFIHCLNGEIEFCVSEQIYLLKNGDSLLFEAMQPHYWRNLSPRPATFLMVFQASHDNSLARISHRTG
jgi:transcriptional regulator with XRE-family HTH domain